MHVHMTSVAFSFAISPQDKLLLRHLLQPFDEDSVVVVAASLLVEVRREFLSSGDTLSDVSRPDVPASSEAIVDGTKNVACPVFSVPPDGDAVFL